MENPETGSTVSGLGGVRKMRVADYSRGKGKRGGLRVLYLDLPAKETTYLLFVYGKDESDDLNPNQKKAVRSLVGQLKKE